MTRTKHKQLFQQIIEYFVAGGAFFWSGYIAFAIFDSLLHWPLFIAKQLANVIGLSVNYVLEDRWVFRGADSKTQHAKRRGGRYIVITLINFGIDYLVVWQLKKAGITPYLGQFVSAGFFTVWNFIWYKYWVFAPHPSKKKGTRELSP